MIKLQAIYNRLQRDLSSQLGYCPKIDSSRAPRYEGLWKDLLSLIEWLGCESILNIRECTDLETDLWSYALFNTQPAPLERVGFHRCSTGTRDIIIAIPDEMVDIVYAFGKTLKPVFLRALRQICLFTYKSKSHEVTEEQRLKAISGFRNRNIACRGLSKSFYSRRAEEGDTTAQSLKVARMLVGIVFDTVDWANIRPAHGPGAVSDSKRGYQKWKNIDGRTTRLCDKFYPISEYFTPTPDLFDHKSASFCDGIAKLTIVPKDRRGPRVICTQPVGLMWIQQGQWKATKRAIETSSILQTNRQFTDGSSCAIQFAKQEINGQLALESSRTREFATIDLSDASDLVSWGLIQFLFNKRNLQFLAASRSTHVKIDEDVVRLHMFAPMGSAMCFPIETIVFWALATARCLVGRGVTYAELSGRATRFLRANRSEVFVFGDDIICRSESCDDVCGFFTEVGFKPNLRKTFSKGFYRESCGVDAFHGERLDIARLQTLTLTSMSDAYATIDLVNRLRSFGMESTAEYLECQVEQWLGFGLAVGLDGALWRRGFPSSVFGQHQALRWNLAHRRSVRFNHMLDFYEAKTIVASPRLEKPPEDGRCRLFRGLTTTVDEHTVDWLSPDNLQYHLGWVRAF